MTLLELAQETGKPPHRPSGRGGRWYWPAVALLLLLHGSLIWVTRTPAITPNANDDAQYLLLSRSIQSLHYRDQHVLGKPVHSQYPPAYPVMLAVWTSVTGRSLDGALLLSLVLALLGLLLLADLARRLAGPVPGLALLAALAVNPWLIGFAGRTVSEQPYLTMSVATLWAMIALPEGRWRTILAGGLAILTGLTRTVGVSMVAAVGLVWLFQKHYRRVLVWGGLAALLVGGWILWTVVAPDQFADRSYAAATGRILDRPGAQITAQLVNRSRRMVSTYLFQSIPTSLQVPTVPGTVIDNIGIVAVIVLLLAAGLWSLRRHPVFLSYLLSYAVVLWAWPFKLTRFMVPLAPVLLLVMVVGLTALARRWGSRAIAVAAVLLCAPLAARGIAVEYPRVEHALGCPRARATDSPVCFNEGQLSFFAAARYAAAHIPRDAAVLTIKEATFSYYSGRQVYHPNLALKQARGDLAGFLQRRNIRYIFVSPQVGGARVVPFVDAFCGQVRLVQRWPGRAFLYHFPADTAAATGSPACVTLDSLARNPERERHAPEDP